MSDRERKAGTPPQPPGSTETLGRRRVAIPTERDARAVGRDESGAPVNRWAVAITGAAKPAQAAGTRTAAGILSLRRQRDAELAGERERAQAAAARSREAEAELARALERFEEQSVIAAELRTMLDATEYRITTLEVEVRAREDDLHVLGAAHVAELVRLADERDALRGALAAAERERAEERARRWIESAALTERQERAVAEKRALLGRLEERDAECVALGAALGAAGGDAAELGRRLDEVSALLEESFAESADLRRRAESAGRDADAERGRADRLGAERDDIAARLAAGLADLAEKTAALEEVERCLAEQHAEREEGERRRASLSALLDEREARIGALESALAALGADGEARALEIGGLRDELAEACAERERLESDLGVERQASAELRALGASGARRHEADAAEIYALGRALGAAREEACELGAALRRRWSELEEARSARRGAEKEVDARGAAVDALRVQLGGALERLEVGHAAALGERDEHVRESQDLRREIERRDADLSRLAAELRRSSEDAAGLESRLIDLQRRGAEDAEERERLAGAAAGAAADLAATRTTAQATADELARAVADLRAREVDLAAAVAMREAGLEELARLARARDAATADLDAVRGELDEARRESETRRRASEEAASRLPPLQQQIRRLEADRERADEAGLRLRQALEARAADAHASRRMLGEALAAAAAAGARAERAESEGIGREKLLATLADELETARRQAAEGAAERAEAQRRIEQETRERAELSRRLAIAGQELEEARHGFAAERGQHEAVLVAALAERDQARQCVEQEAREREELAQLLAIAGQELEEARRGFTAERGEHEAVLVAALAERDQARQCVEREARERAELAQLLAIAGQELEEARRGFTAAREEHEAALAALAADRERLGAGLEDAEAMRRDAAENLAQLRSLLERRDEEVCALRFAFEQSQMHAERSCEAQAVMAADVDALRQELAASRQRAEASQAEIETLVVRTMETAGSAREEAELRVKELEQAQQVGELREGALQSAVNELQEQLLREQAHAAALWNDLESQTRFREALDSALAEARSRSAELEALLQKRLHEADEDAERAKAESSARAEQLEMRLGDAAAENTAMRDQLAAVRALAEGLERESEQLRRRAAGSEERDRQRGDSAKLQARLEELERQQREAVQRHTAAVNGYMLELNQRNDTLRQRDAEVHRLTEEIAVLQAACDDAVAQLADVRNDRDLLQLRAREGEASRGQAARAERHEPAHSSPVRAGASEERPAREELRLAEPKRAGEERKRPAAVSDPRRASSQAIGEPVVVVHVDDDAGTQDAVRAMLARYPLARYATLAQMEEQAPASRRVLAVNMLSRTADPLATVTESAKLGIGDPSAFTYFAYGGRGFTLGMVDFFPHPFEVDACASRLLGRPGGLQRLLAVSEDVDLMSGVREVLGRVRCSVATAFDGRQALDLVPMIKPEVVLVDLALPRGEALRIVSRLRTDPKTASISVAMLWTAPLTHKDLAQAALRIVRDFALTPEDVGRGLERLLTDDDMGLVSREAIRQVG